MGSAGVCGNRFYSMQTARRVNIRCYPRPAMVRLVGLDSICLCDLEGNVDKMIIKIVFSIAFAVFIYMLWDAQNE